MCALFLENKKFKNYLQYLQKHICLYTGVNKKAVCFADRPVIAQVE